MVCMLLRLDIIPENAGHFICISLNVMQFINFKSFRYCINSHSWIFLKVRIYFPYGKSSLFYLNIRFSSRHGCYCKNKLRFVYSLIVKIRAIKKFNVLPCTALTITTFFMFTHVVVTTSGCNNFPRKKERRIFSAFVCELGFFRVNSSLVVLWLNKTYPYRCFDGNIFISISPMRIFYFQIGWILILLRID